MVLSGTPVDRDALSPSWEDPQLGVIREDGHLGLQPEAQAEQFMASTREQGPGRDPTWEKNLVFTPNTHLIPGRSHILTHGYTPQIPQSPVSLQKVLFP